MQLKVIFELLLSHNFSVSLKLFQRKKLKMDFPPLGTFNFNTNLRANSKIFIFVVL